MARKMRRLAAVALVCVSSVGAVVAIHQPMHGSAITGNCNRLDPLCSTPWIHHR
jgi:hypothetical protein